MAQILLVDDEPMMLDLLKLYLEPHGFRCLKAASGEEALNLLDLQRPDLVLLDIMMPGMDGWTVCREIRHRSAVPILMLTARGETEDVVKGLGAGADDYLIKPFEEEELVARLHALLRRSGMTGVLETGGLIYDRDSFTLTYGGKPIRLTPKEFALLGKLMSETDRVFSRDNLLGHVWGWDSETEGRTVDSHVRNLREKIRNSGFPIDHHLLTVRGIGYKWSDKGLY
ncbi:DNA-binding response regulator, OmpR family, contains REC and winged-helix (wHTH) domain [Bhargavaea ginsengi]|uniref:DNA-binding response regulator, OmpR family, contains REC and winged-helix (WHTH) domain n=1 Tax=Bhargavaea ginsengi TaxID=426757 RepID=A0A1H7BQ54_9BACL|nr:response regulator transcription factor [Bhargavaea ginsengi]MCM3089004.1 response regulator transcription factor [Bhargavaea ginsengi]SEJ79611.1 DNA-binding response regulator, OmpR family, contains REC and winged-helix (wHTH) domain [Bhargavaea ginsengi]